MGHVPSGTNFQIPNSFKKYIWAIHTLLSISNHSMNKCSWLHFTEINRCEAMSCLRDFPVTFKSVLWLNFYLDLVVISHIWNQKISASSLPSGKLVDHWVRRH